MKHRTALLLALFAVASAHAQAPAGHPTTGSMTGHPVTGGTPAAGHGGAYRFTPDMVAPAAPTKAAELPNEGKVISAVEASGYSYVEVSIKDGTQWIAGPATPIKAGDTIRFSDGPVMTNFTSKSLRRSFPSITFVDHVMVVGK